MGPKKNEKLFENIQFLLSIPTIIALSLAHLLWQQEPQTPMFVLVKSIIPSLIAVLIGFMIYYWCFVKSGLKDQLIAPIQFPEPLDVNYLKSELSNIEQMAEVVENIVSKRSEDQKSHLDKTAKDLAHNITSVSNEIRERIIQSGQDMEKTNDIFISAPMAGLGDDTKYQEMKNLVMDVKNVLVDELKFKTVLYAGENISDVSEFDSPTVSQIVTLNGLMKSKFFLLIYPEKVASSVLVETGWALASGIKTIIFVKNKKHLPYLLQDNTEEFNKSKIITYKDNANLLKIMRKNKKEIFS